MKILFNIGKTILALILIACSACTGIEVGGKLGVYRVDERQESSRTNVDNRVPLKCYFVQCFEPSNESK